MNDIKYINNNFRFQYRVSALIYNKDKTKILLFYGNDNDFYMLPGGKVHELEKSNDAIKREIQEELGINNLDFKLIGISEEIGKFKNLNVQQITLTYESIYTGYIKEKAFKGKDTDYNNFKWVNISELSNYKMHPNNVFSYIKNCNSIIHIVENFGKL